MHTPACGTAAGHMKCRNTQNKENLAETKKSHRFPTLVRQSQINKVRNQHADSELCFFSFFFFIFFVDWADVAGGRWQDGGGLRFSAWQQIQKTKRGIACSTGYWGNQQRYQQQQLGKFGYLDAPRGGFVGAGNQQTKPKKSQQQRFAWICCRKQKKKKRKSKNEKPLARAICNIYLNNLTATGNKGNQFWLRHSS